MSESVTFIRIPKNASTSLYSFFGEANTIRNEQLNANNARYLSVFEPSHRNIVDAEETLGSEILDLPVLAVVRNPFERLVSMFFFARKHNLGNLYDVNTAKFPSFVRDFHKLSSDDNFFHAMSMCDYIKHDRNSEFTIVRFENLIDGVYEFLKDSQLYFKSGGLQKLNSTTHRHYSEYYDANSKAIVSDMWGMDLDKFLYSFDD